MRVVVAAAVLLFANLVHADPQPPTFDAAYDAMIHGDFVRAAAGFHAVADADPAVRERATALADLADAFVRRGARLVDVAQAPGATPDAPTRIVEVSEDDTSSGGRASFVVTTTMAAFYSGIVAVDLLDLDSVRSGTLVVMGATAVGVTGSLFGTRGRTITSGMADAYSFGLLAGATNSLLLAGPLGLYRADSNASEKVQSFVLASSWGSATAALLLADQLRPTRGQVSVVETFGAMGIASTMLGFAIAQPDDLDGDTFLGVTAAGFDIGIGAGAVFANKLDWSHSRARYVNLGAFLGGLLGAGSSLVASGGNGDRSDARISAAVTLAGLWGGFALTSYLTRDMSPDYRFRTTHSTTVAPTVVNHAPGLAISGAF